MTAAVAIPAIVLDDFTIYRTELMDTRNGEVDYVELGLGPDGLTNALAGLAERFLNLGADGEPDEYYQQELHDQETLAEEYQDADEIEALKASIRRIPAVAKVAEVPSRELRATTPVEVDADIEDLFPGDTPRDALHLLYGFFQGIPDEYRLYIDTVHVHNIAALTR